MKMWQGGSGVGSGSRVEVAEGSKCDKAACSRVEGAARWGFGRVAAGWRCDKGAGG